MTDDLLIQSATVQRWSNREPGEDFTLSPAWDAVATGIPCNVQEKSGQVVGGANGQSVSYTAVGYFLPGADVHPDPADENLGDRLIVDGKVYQVRAVTDQTGRGAFLKAYLVSV